MAMSFICDVCGREVNGITIVNGMNFCAKCYQETFVIPKPLSVQDLENCVKIECQQCKQKDQRIAELESEVEQLKAKLEIWNRFNKEDYIHKGEKATERDYYYYTNGASSVLENEVEQLKKENADLKKDLQEAIDLIEENNNAFNKTFEDIKNNAVVFYEKKDKEFLELKKELEIYKKEKK